MVLVTIMEERVFPRMTPYISEHARRKAEAEEAKVRQRRCTLGASACNGTEGLTSNGFNQRQIDNLIQAMRRFKFSTGSYQEEGWY